MIDRFKAGEYITIGGSMMIIIGAFLPWVSIGGGIGSIHGIESHGLFSILFALSSIGLILFREWDHIDHIGVLTMGILTIIVVLNIFLAINRPTGEVVTLSAAPDVGLFITLFGGFTLILGGGYGYKNWNRDASDVENIEEDAVDIVDQLEEFKRLEQNGIISEDEFEQKKKELLNQD